MLRVITHTQPGREELLDRCIKSVQEALPPNAEHLVVRTSSYMEWAMSRAELVMSSNLACFVDDDDEIHPDAIKHCLSALEDQNLGVACTNEVVVMSLGNEQEFTYRKSYNGVMTTPREVHHLCVIRGAAVDKTVPQHISRLRGIGTDWLIKSSACLQHGGIQVPMNGYRWYMTPNSDMAVSRAIYAAKIPELQKITQGWRRRHGYLDQYDLAQTAL